MASTGLQAALDTADAAAAEARGAENQLADVYAALQAVLADSADDDAHIGLASLVEAQGQLAEAVAAIGAGFDLLKEYADYIGQGNDSAPGQHDGGGQLPVAAAFNPRKFHATKLAGLRRYSEAGTAEGRLYREDGAPHSDRVLRARPPGSSPFPPASVRERYRNTTPNRGHIEGEVAAAMHRERMRETTLYLNAEPCDNLGRGCKENTHAFLPEGSVLNIWAVNDDGSRVFKRINGTGDAIDGTGGHAGPGADGGAGEQVHGRGDAGPGPV
ncbi:DddA-like double-stranded DNA deaminase toxin [Glycomyces artemisiae]|uniref:DddA-like double-stranded DNA deaminase toxin n=1 Tax=Glycomyces artemisiae TaxID=1076443 RepID=UPI000D05410C|nr:DddA-like double-stranded DNA deaminase toxin [Glycomyces artemisiae]